MSRRIPAPLLVACPWCSAPRLEGCDVPPPPPGRPVVASVHEERIRAAAAALERGELEPPRPEERARLGARRARGLGVLAAALAGAVLFPELAREVLEARRVPPPPDPEPWPVPSAYMAEALEGGRWWWWCGDCDGRGEAEGLEAHHRCSGEGEALELRRIPAPARGPRARGPRRAPRAPAGEVLEAEVLEDLPAARLLEAPAGEDS